MTVAFVGLLADFLLGFKLLLMLLCFYLYSQKFAVRVRNILRDALGTLRHGISKGQATGDMGERGFRFRVYIFKPSGVGCELGRTALSQPLPSASGLIISRLAAPEGWLCCCTA